MPNLLAMSFEGELAPSFDLRCLRPEGKLPDGWGIGFYPGGEPSAQILKEAAPPAQGSIRSELVRAWQHLESSLFVLHVRHARWGQLSDANTQPFLRSYGGRDWLIAHAGSLANRLEVPEGARFEPVGSTDTERIFCVLLGRFAERGWKSLGEADPAVVREWIGELNDQGSMTMVLADGRDLCVYADRASTSNGIHLCNVAPPYESVLFGDADLQVDLTSRGIQGRKGVVISTDPLEPGSAVKMEWQKLAPGELLIIRQGSIRARVTSGEDGAPHVSRSQPRMSVVRPEATGPRTYDVTHRTTYRYAKAIERST
ncbi:MAG TPA: class II glutamine amidotransferase, partial [Polyangiaceae bacterium]